MQFPDRISGAIAALERGEQVDWNKIHDLQALDLAVIGQQFAQEAMDFNAEMDEAAIQAARGK